MPAPSDQRFFSAPVQAWFDATFEAPTPAQSEAWGAIRDGADVLVAAPTGSGKTLAAFLCAIDDLVVRSRAAPLEDRVHVLYVSPLKALSNDIERNLQHPLGGIEERLAASGDMPTGIRAMVRTGDTTPGEREQMRRRPPHLLVTTPESLYLLLTADSGRAMLAGVETVIVDEIHALAGSKRGSHLALSLARLDALCECRPRRLGLSATQKPIERMAQFLCGDDACRIVDSGHQRDRDLALELTGSPLSAVMANEVWEEVYDRLAELVEAHVTTLIFVNTRRLAERLTRHLAERIGEAAITAHHGSLSRTHRFEAEQALKDGKLRALVATASLELGIDIGHVDLVCQLGSPGSMAAFLQRVGRSGHRVGETPKGRLFPLSRDDLVECTALLLAVEEGELDAIRIPQAPLDVLAQQVVAEVSAREWSCDALYEAVIRAWPYRHLRRDAFDAVVRMLAEGYSTRRGRRSAWVFHDGVNGRLRARPAARLTALQNGGTIPDQFDYEVVMLPQGHRIGSLNEDFAFESLPGDIFQLGNTSYRILKIEQGRVLVEDAAGQPPTIPFWFGDRPGRSDELSLAVSSLRAALAGIFMTQGPAEADAWLREAGIPPVASAQLVAYLHAAWQALDGLPTATDMVMERFFDDTGDMHLVIHAPLGSRLMRAWGLALRKRFCRRFNFELQASALEDALILSLGETHSFDLEEVLDYLKPETVREVLVQALLDAPMFGTRWRWNATIALALQRMRNGKRLPPVWQRNQAEDLVAVVFPDQIACAENLAGAREVPDHPLVTQTVEDCLTDTMDIEGLEALLRRMRLGEVRVRCLDLTGPSPLAAEIINARPYAFLDDGDAEGRRTRAIGQRPDDLEAPELLRIISVEATHQVRDEAWIAPRNADELHDGLLQAGFFTQAEFSTGDSTTGAPGDARRWPGWFATLADERRACAVVLPGGERHWVAAERLSEWLAVHPGSTCNPGITPLPPTGDVQREQSLVGLLRDRLALLGPVDAASLAAQFALPERDIQVALLSLQGEGYAVRMATGEEDGRWCERRLLARIHRYSREQRRRAVRPVPPAAYARFLARWHHLDERDATLDAALDQLEGWTAPVAAWETSLLPGRCRDAEPGQLDQLFLSGRRAWFRPPGGSAAERQVVSASPIAIVPRGNLADWLRETEPGAEDQAARERGAHARPVLDALAARGAMFTEDLERATGLLRPQLEEGLKALVYEGRVTADAFSPLRWLLRPEAQKARIESRRGRHALGPVGRWSLLDAGPDVDDAGLIPSRQRQERLVRLCMALLRRYGVVFRAVLQREPLLPPWRELLVCLRRQEDRGEVRGGRFVDGFSGEQFALPEAVGLLHQCRERGEGPLRVISAADPLNLGGFILPGPRTPSLSANRVLLEDGLPVARLVGDNVEELPGISVTARASAHELLRVVTPIQRARLR